MATTAPSFKALGPLLYDKHTRDLRRVTMKGIPIHLSVFLVIMMNEKTTGVANKMSKSKP